MARTEGHDIVHLKTEETLCGRTAMGNVDDFQSQAKNGKVKAKTTF